MYESPIEIFRAVDDIIKQVNEGTDKMVCEAVIKCGVNVNKDELIKALQYDREQYAKGYNDGIKEFAERLSDLTAYYWLDNINKGHIDDLVKEMEVSNHDTRKI